MKSKSVIVAPYQAEWKDEFEKIKAYLSKNLEDCTLGIEHVGSTSVKGLSAKPVIDLDVIIEDQKKFETVKNRLECLGYFYQGDQGIADREAFRYDGKTEFMAHHLYVCPKDSEELKRHLVFRDHLRSHKEDRDRYSSVKMEAAKKFPLDREQYMAYKSAVIKEIYRKCGLC